MRKPFCTCLRLHTFSFWEHIQELPVWQNNSERAIGFQPLRRQLYEGSSGVFYKEEPNHLFLLVGKLIEQHRTCSSCGYVEINKQFWKV